MENPKLTNRKTTTRVNTRTIGINTDTNLMNSKCVKCLQDCAKFSYVPVFCQFPYPFCNCMYFSHYQNNMIDCSNSCCRSCKCQNKNYLNACNSQHYMQNNTCSSSSSSYCQNCGSKSSCNISETTHQNLSNEAVETVEEKHENILNVSPTSSNNSINEENVCRKDETEHNNTKEEISNSITKYATDFLEKKYRSKYGSKQKIHAQNEEQNKDNIELQNANTNNTNDKQLLNHLLKPNTTTTNNKIIVVANDDSDDYIDSDTEEIISEDDGFSGKTVIDANRDRPSSSDDRRPTRININNRSQHTLKRPQSLNRNPDVEMLMMIKALVNNHNQYETSTSPPLNKLLNHIGSESGDSNPAANKFNSLTPRRKMNTKNFANITLKLNENKKPL